MVLARIARKAAWKAKEVSFVAAEWRPKKEEAKISTFLKRMCYKTVTR